MLLSRRFGAAISLYLLCNVVTSFDFPAIGFEFELNNLKLQRPGRFANIATKRALKGNQINLWNNVTRTRQPMGVGVFNLTGDILPEWNDGVSFEFIADASQLHLVNANMREIGEELRDYIIRVWNPLSALDRTRYYGLTGSDLNDWQLYRFENTCNKTPTNSSTIMTLSHITVSQDLAGIQKLFRKGYSGRFSFLRTTQLRDTPGYNREVYITNNYFTDGVNGIYQYQLNESILGFLSWMMSYAKSSPQLGESVGINPKLFFDIMPRTSWLKWYEMAAIPGINDRNTLYKLAQELAMRKRSSANWARLEWDNEYVNTWLYTTNSRFEQKGWEAMVSKQRAEELRSQGSKLVELFVSNFLGSGDEIKVSLTVRKWIDGIQAGIDWLRLFETTLFNAQLGALGDAVEPLYNGLEKGGIVEFRTKWFIPIPYLPTYMNASRQDVIDLQDKSQYW